MRPIDPSAWVAHTTALQQQSNLQRGGPLASSMDTMSTLTSSSLTSSMPDSSRKFNYLFFVNHAILNKCHLNMHFCTVGRRWNCSKNWILIFVLRKTWDSWLRNSAAMLDTDNSSFWEYLLMKLVSIEFSLAATL